MKFRRVDARSYYNQACVDDGANGAASVCADVTTPGTQVRTLNITKNVTEASFTNRSEESRVGDVASNDGNTKLAAEKVTDPNASGLSCTPSNGSSLALEQSTTYTVTV